MQFKTMKLLFYQTADELMINLHTASQMRAMKTIPIASLILHEDATGSFFTVNKYHSTQYKRIMN